MIVLVLPLLVNLHGQNLVAIELVGLLQANNLAAPTSSSADCEYLESSVKSWLSVAVVPQPASLLTSAEDTFVLWAQLLPVRCSFQNSDGVITFCDGNDFNSTSQEQACLVWDHGPDIDEANAFCGEEVEVENCLDDYVAGYFASDLNLRRGGIRSIRPQPGLFLPMSEIGEFADYEVTVVYNENPTIAFT